MPYRIFTDAMCDLPKEMTDRWNISVVPMVYHLNDIRYRYLPVQSQIPLEIVYSHIRGDLVSEACHVYPNAFYNAFEPVLQAGEDILYIGVSDGLSDAYETACEVISSLELWYPNRKILAINSYSISLGEGLLVLHAARKQNTLDLDALVHWVEMNKRAYIHQFLPNNILALWYDRRVSFFAVVLSALFRMKTFCHVGLFGYITIGKKVIGRKRSLLRLVDSLVQRIDTIATDIVFIGHCDAHADAEFVASLIHEKLPDISLQIEPIGLTIGGLLGPGTVALFFVRKPL